LQVKFQGHGGSYGLSLKLSQMLKSMIER